MMPRRQKREESPVPFPTDDYWERFLRSQNLLGLRLEARLAGGEEVEVPLDPEFLEFLKVASTYGAPKNLKEFKEKSREDQLFYLGAYKEYLKEEKKRIQAERLKTHR